MTDAIRMRLADPERDAKAVAAIYLPAVKTSAASFEEVPPDAGEMADRIRQTLLRTPWLVAEDPDAGGVIGYSYAGPHHRRAGYRWSVDVSAYLHPEWRGRGIGRGLYDVLLPILRRQQFVNVFAGIALPNPASVALHEAIGMRRIGVYERVGYKFGAWHDVGWWGMRITEPNDPPAEPIPLPELSGEGRVDAAAASA
ncbi:MAG: GNAT family N-acetyltransferase [Candidatus Limnocylindria bacterium]